MSAGLVPTLTQYSVPDYVHMNNIPAHHFQRPAGLDPAMDGADGVSGGGGTLDPGPAGRSGLGVGGARPKPIVMGAR